MRYPEYNDKVSMCQDLFKSALSLASLIERLEGHDESTIKAAEDIARNELAEHDSLDRFRSKWFRRVSRAREKSRNRGTHHVTERMYRAQQILREVRNGFQQLDDAWWNHRFADETGDVEEAARAEAEFHQLRKSLEGRRPGGLDIVGLWLNNFHY